MRRRAEISADQIVLMMSSVTSSYSADGLSEQSQESAGSLHPDARRSDVVEKIFSRKLLFTIRCYLEIAVAKRCRLHKLIRQRFSLALKIQQEDFALISAVASYSDFSRNAKISSRSVCTSRRKKINLLLLKRIQEKQLMNHTQATAASNRELICISCCYSTSRKLCIFSRLGSQAQRIEEVAKRSSRSDKPVEKQLTTHEEFTKDGCQLLSSIQMAKMTRSLQKKRTQTLRYCLEPVVANLGEICQQQSTVAKSTWVNVTVAQDCRRANARINEGMTRVGQHF
ncbi:hypothetical protein F511_07770 [Dorcoceras hygrometricum]|uniref:Uncharacterized protein n=1 Tax=Dorcoceras hygrometricum TaxID=472368 RepID=A0A2Z7CTU8_9LAMI|nr:hypothetical protein F511_07770 [Dorcoceras hygrometricum]